MQRNVAVGSTDQSRNASTRNYFRARHAHASWPIAAQPPTWPRPGRGTQRVPSLRSASARASPRTVACSIPCCKPGSFGALLIRPAGQATARPRGQLALRLSTRIPSGVLPLSCLTSSLPPPPPPPPLSFFSPQGFMTISNNNANNHIISNVLPNRSNILRNRKLVIKNLVTVTTF